MIARAYGVPVSSILRANPHKPLAVVRGRQTFDKLHAGERLRIPVGVGDGDLGDATFVVRSTDTKGPWGFAQQQMGDGNVGYRLLKKLNPSLAPKWDAGRNWFAGLSIVIPSEWPAAGGAPAAPPAPAALPAALPSLPSALPQIIPASLPSIPAAIPTPNIAANAIAALASVDPCSPGSASMVCQVQSLLGLKADGKYGRDTAAAVRAVFPGAPPACNASGVAPLFWGSKDTNLCVGGGAAQPLPVPGPTPGLPVSLPSLPAPSQVSPGLPQIPPQILAPLPQIPSPAAPQPTQAQAAPVPAAPVPVPTTTTAEVVVPPEKKGLSTGAIVAGAVGAAALVGLIAVVATSKGRTSTTKTTTVRRAPARRSKPTKKRRK